MSTSTTEAVVNWLLSADHVPQNLAARLHLPPPTRHTVTAWRFRGRWTHGYAGELGQASSTHTTNVVEEVNPDGSLDQRVEGTTSTPGMTWREVSGTHGAPFDVVVVEGAVPEPPGAGFAAKAARSAVESAGEPGSASELWQGPGMQRVEDEAGVGLRAHLGSPHLNRLAIDTQIELVRSDWASVVLLAFDGQLDGTPWRLVLGPDGSAWGSPPRDESRKEQLSGGSAKIVLAALFWIVAAIVGLFAFVIPGLVAGAIGFFHVRSLIRKRDQSIELWREQERPAVTALVSGLSASWGG